jgi:hypothetical protein
MNDDAFGFVARPSSPAKIGNPMTRPTKAITIAEFQALLTAVPKYFPNFGFLLGSQTYTTAQIMTAVTAVTTSATTAAAAKAASHDAVLADEKVQAQYAPVIKELRQYIGVAYSNSSSILAEFGLTPPKVRAPLSATARAAAEAKAAATRLARGTAGKKQKALITGNVSGVTITPTTVVPATAATATSTPSAGTSSTTLGQPTPVLAAMAGGTVPTPHI